MTILAGGDAGPYADGGDDNAAHEDGDGGNGFCSFLYQGLLLLGGMMVLAQLAGCCWPQSCAVTARHTATAVALALAQ